MKRKRVREEDTNMEGGQKDLTLLFQPRSIAVVGASRDLSSIGGLPIRFLMHHGYKGNIFPVNPKYEEIAGLICYPSLADLPEPVDVALVSVPKMLVFDTVRQCADKNVSFVILFSAGYAEISAEGREEQDSLREFARQAGIRVVGPNCIGLINTYERVAASFTSGLAIDSLIPGFVAVITQSGGIGNAMLTRANDRFIGLSAFVSSGNEVDLEAADFVRHLVRDPRTRSFALFLEDLKSPKKFALAAEMAFCAGKPIVALKVGRSEKGQQAAASHTGAMSGADELYEGFFRQKGICRVFDIDDLLEVANLFSRYDPPGGNRAAIISSSGGSGALLADLVSNVGLRLPSPSPQTRQKLQHVVPALASMANPMDITTQFLGDAEIIVRYLQAFSEDENFDVLVFNFTFSAPERTLRLAERIVEARARLSKPLVISWPLGDITRKAFQHIERSGIPLFFQPARCASALGHFVRYGALRNSRANSPFAQDATGD